MFRISAWWVILSRIAAVRALSWNTFTQSENARFASHAAQAASSQNLQFQADERH
jgi:hypothetical protein